MIPTSKKCKKHPYKDGKRDRAVAATPAYPLLDREGNLSICIFKLEISIQSTQPIH